jgi:hypothetical protein
MSNTTMHGAYEEVAFKRVSGGFLFRAPSPWPWPFARARHYLVTEAQKAAIIEALDRARQHVVPILLIPLFVALGVLAKIFSDWSLLFFLMMVPLGLLVGCLITHRRWRAVRPLIAGLPPSEQSITLRELFATYAAVSSLWYHAGFGILFALMAADYAPIGGDRLHVWDRPIFDPMALGAWAFAAVLAAIATFLLGVAIFKTTQSRKSR